MNASGASTRPQASRPSRIAAAGVALLCSFLWHDFAQAHQEQEERDCKLVGVGGYTDSRRQDSVNYRHHATGGIDYRCTDGTRIRADSAVVWERSGNAFFVGNVYFEDPDTELTADSARYFDNTQELIAYANVVLTDRKGGAVIRGETLNYLSESRFRRYDRILVYGGSPRATVHPARRPAAPVAPAQEQGDGLTSETEDPEGDGVPDEVAGEVVDSAADPAAVAGTDSAGGPEGGPVADNLAGEAEVPATDSIVESAGEETDSTGAQAPADAADSLGIEAGDPMVDVVAGDVAPSVGGENPELARLDSIAGIVGEPSGEPGGEDEAADAPADSVTPAPYEVEAPRIMIDGRRFFRAGGGVAVTRDSLLAAGDSLNYDQEVGAMWILGDASVEDSGFRLKGLSVSVTPVAGLDEEILAREEAGLTGDDMVMTAPAIRLFLEDGMVGRLVALPTVPPLPEPVAEGPDTTGLTPGDAARVLAMAEAAAAEEPEEEPEPPPRPSVVAAQFHLTGDSIDVLSPGQVLDVVTAVGTARADAMDQDSLLDPELPEIARNDWMEGETIIARFVTDDPEADSAPPAPDSAAGRPRLESLTAVDDARSLYRLYLSDTTGVETDTSGAEPDTLPDEPGGPEFPSAPDADSSASADSAPPAPDPDTVAAENGQAAEECDTSWADGERPPELHYVSGNQITIFLEGRKVVRMEVTGRTQGYHFEPEPPGCEPAGADTAATPGAPVTPPDTTTAIADTSTIPPDTTATTTTTRPLPTPRTRARSHIPRHALPSRAPGRGPHAPRRAGRPS